MALDVGYLVHRSVLHRINENGNLFGPYLEANHDPENHLSSRLDASSRWSLIGSKSQAQTPVIMETRLYVNYKFKLPGVWRTQQFC